MLFRSLLIFALTLVCAKNEINERNYLRKISNNMNLEIWKSSPTPAPAPKPVKSNPNSKCTLQSFGSCNSNEYCKLISNNMYHCTLCPQNKKCTG